MSESPAILPALLLDRGVERYGSQCAIAMETRRISYDELASSANRIARSLLRHGIGKGERVLLWTNRSPEAVAAIWGILKAGAAYVPMDPMLPAERLAAIASDCQVTGIVSASDHASQIEQALRGGASMRAVWMLDDINEDHISTCPVINGAEIGRESSVTPTLDLDGEDLASIQYTSGSTGTPKGVMIPHRALFSQADWTVNRYGLKPEDRMAAFMPVHSPMATFDIFASAAAGATSVMISPRIASFPAAIAKTFSEEQVTSWYLVTTLLVMMLSRGNLRAHEWPALRFIAYGGERLALKQLRDLMEIFPHVKFIHVYSRTEIKIRSYHQVKDPPDELDTRQIGEVADELRMLVLDENQRLVAPGAVGELWVAGPGMTLGYWGHPELTTETLRWIDLGGGDKIYAARTGDLVRRNADGSLELVGRTDSQVKVRGFRVDLGELEAALQRHPGVERAVVLAESDEQIGGRLRAIVVAKKDGGADERALRDYCIATLPRYMVPDVFEFRAELPVNSNGKVDRQALSASSEAGKAVRKS